MPRVILAVLLFIVVCAFAPAPATAQFSGQHLQCDAVNNAASTTTSCTAAFPQTCVFAGELEFVIVASYGNGTAVTFTFSDNIDGAWMSGPSVGTTRYLQHGFYMIASTSACRTYTATASPGATAIATEIHPWAVSGSLQTLGSVLDCSATATGSNGTFTSVGVTPRLTGNCVTTFSNDLQVGGINCASTSSSEFSTSPGWGKLTDSFTSPKDPWIEASIILSAGPGTTQGTFVDSFLGPCVFTGGEYGTQLVMSFKAANGAPSSPNLRHSTIIKYRQKYYRIPWDTRRRKLQIVSI